MVGGPDDFRVGGDVGRLERALLVGVFCRMIGCVVDDGLKSGDDIVMSSIVD